MEPRAAGSDGLGVGAGKEGYINVLVMAGTQRRDSSIHTVAHIKLLKNNVAIWTHMTNMQHGVASVNCFCFVFLLIFISSKLPLKIGQIMKTTIFYNGETLNTPKRLIILIWVSS